jgi:hypothetical protein
MTLIVVLLLLVGSTLPAAAQVDATEKLNVAGLWAMFLDWIHPFQKGGSTPDPDGVPLSGPETGPLDPTTHTQTQTDPTTQSDGGAETDPSG